jgi:Zn-dependent peptidase ImmA (M78 family)
MNSPVPKKLQKLLSSVIDMVNKAYPNSDNIVISYSFLGSEDVMRFYPQFATKAGWSHIPSKRSDKHIVIFNTDLLKTYDEDIGIYTFVHELLHCIFHSDDDKIVHPATLEFLEKHYHINAKDFMKKYGFMYYGPRQE